MAQRIDILGVHSSDPALNEFAEGMELGHRAFADVHGEQHGLLDHLPEADAISLRRLNDLRHSCIADASCGIVDDALEGLFVVRVGHQTEIGNHILDLLALVETQAAVDAIRNVIPTHLLLKATALRVRAV